MNKESIYKIIGYNGEYNTNVKRAIRKLLKENHPDKNGNRKIFELINEVKEELENNKVSYNPKKDNYSAKIKDDIDYNYCFEMIEKITKEKRIYTDILKKKKDKLSKDIKDYQNYYRDSIDLETYLLSNSQYMNKLKSNRTISVIVLVLTIILFLVAILKNSMILFILFVILVFVCVIIIYRSFMIIQKIAENNRNKVSSYVGINSKLRNNKDNQDKLKKEINELNNKINDMDNDLRFYKNLFNNR